MMNTDDGKSNNTRSRAELYRQSTIVDAGESANSPIWNAAVRSKSARIPHLLSPGSSENISEESISPTSQRLNTEDTTTTMAYPPPTTHQLQEDKTDGMIESSYNETYDDDDIEQGPPALAAISFEDSVDVDSLPKTMTMMQKPTTTPSPPARSRPNKPSLTINTRDVWEEHPGKKSRSETYQLDTPSTAATTPTSPTDSVYTIEHKHVYKKSKQSKALAFSKPMVGIAGIIVVALTGGGAFLLSEWFTIPGLNAQIEELTAQVDRLTLQVDRLEDENDRFEQLNDRLEEENSVFASEIVKFNNTNALYAELNVELAELTDDNERLNYMLDASNVKYQQLNQELSQTKDSLNKQVNALSTENTKLSETVTAYTKQNKVLAGQVDRLETINGDMAEQMEGLNNSVANLSRENGRLSKLNDDLRVIVTFLDETAGSLKDSYEDVVRSIANQISAGRAIWTTTTKNIYRSRTNNMVCDIQSRFSGQPFIVDATLPIGEANYPEVMSYVDEHFLSELCLSRDEFELFLAESVGSEISDTDTLSNIALEDLVKAMMRFNSMVMDYYFPRDTSQVDSNTSLNMTDWSGANYQCENIPREKRFAWPAVTQQPKTTSP
mmetsp:Transcript_10444/g.23423  ORF Transcript_10444/g.23423 Transcript_10444/m.23423 type:complete len:610 (+) Transcript_10444:238-2067(+)